jgi:hypothetical protein
MDMFVAGALSLSLSLSLLVLLIPNPICVSERYLVVLARLDMLIHLLFRKQAESTLKVPGPKNQTVSKSEAFGQQFH